MISVLPRKDYWVGLMAWRHRTNQVYLGIAFWVVVWKVSYKSAWYQVVRHLPLGD